jgi:CRP-like cAMP-binding protein
MIAEDYLRRIAIWSRELDVGEIEVARTGIMERSYAPGESIFLRGDHFDYWTGVVSGLARMGIVSREGKATSFTGLTAGAWFGEGTMLKKEARRYDVVALRDTRLALMDRATFFWLYEHSAAFNRFLVVQLNERLGQFIGLVEYGRTLDATGRLARSVAWLFNPILYPDPNPHLEITQEEIGALSGISRQNANQCLKRLEREGLLRLEYGGVTIVDLERLRGYGDESTS